MTDYKKKYQKYKKKYISIKGGGDQSSNMGMNEQFNYQQEYPQMYQQQMYQQQMVAPQIDYSSINYHQGYANGFNNGFQHGIRQVPNPPAPSSSIFFGSIPPRSLINSIFW